VRWILFLKDLGNDRSSNCCKYGLPGGSYENIVDCILPGSLPPCYTLLVYLTLDSPSSLVWWIFTPRRIHRRWVPLHVAYLAAACPDHREGQLATGRTIATTMISTSQMRRNSKKNVSVSSRLHWLCLCLSLLSSHQSSVVLISTYTWTTPPEYQGRHCRVVFEAAISYFDDLFQQLRAFYAFHPSTSQNHLDYYLRLCTT